MTDKDTAPTREETVDALAGEPLGKACVPLGGCVGIHHSALLARAETAEAALAEMTKGRDRWMKLGYKLGGLGQLQAERELAIERARTERVRESARKYAQFKGVRVDCGRAAESMLRAIDGEDTDQ